MRAGGLVLLLLPLCAARLPAQTPAARFLQEARTQIDALHNDSAISLLRTATDTLFGATLRERIHGYTLLGVAYLSEDRRAEARQAFQAALALDPNLSVDSLADLHSDLVNTFAAERAARARMSRFAIVVEVPTDTAVLRRGGGYQVVVSTSLRAEASILISDAAGRPVFRDSQQLAGVGGFDWPLRTPDGEVIPAGRYRLHVEGRDSAGATDAKERLLEVEAAVPDTQVLPAPPRPGELAPESLRTRQRYLRPLLVGGAAAAVAAALASYGPGPGGASDGRAFGVSGAALVAGFAGYLAGRIVWQPDPAAAEANQRIRDDYTRRRAAAEAFNARQRNNAMIRVRTVRQGG